MSEKVERIINQVVSQFRNRTVFEGKKKGIDFGIELSVSIDDNTLWLSFVKQDTTHNVTIPLPFKEKGIELVKQNDVVRAVCSFWMEERQVELDYLSIMYEIILAVPPSAVKHSEAKATPFLQRMITSSNPAITAYQFQKAVNAVIHQMPLHETVMNSFVANNRMIVLDEAFGGSPANLLTYQVNKVRKYHSMGWTTSGLSDGVLASKNYILKFDIRKFSPFGLRYHNPQRNLYSTLGMVGEETPLIKSQSSDSLEAIGVGRTGYNWFTAFVDIPDVFEDQIMVDIGHANKYIKNTRRFQTFGNVVVIKGQRIRTGDAISINKTGNDLFDLQCEYARVLEVKKTTVNISGTAVNANNIIIEYSRKFKEGFKVTNLHGNKGVIRLQDLGFATDPRTGKKRKIDIIVGAKTVGKRKNYGQILEALTSCIVEADYENSNDNRAMRFLHPESAVTNVPATVIPDDWDQPVSEIEDGLVRRGYRKDGTWDCDIYAGKVKAVCGKVFWGIIKTPEDQLWEDDETEVRDNKELRIMGLKFSHVEFRALETVFGKDNPVTDEIMRYAQGSENVSDLLKVLKSKFGELPERRYVVNYADVKSLDQVKGVMVDKVEITGSIVDEEYYPSGFLLELPSPFMTAIAESKSKIETIYEGPVAPATAFPGSKVYVTDKVFIPSGVLRKCWKHGSGKYGLSEVGVLVNGVISVAKRMAAAPEDQNLVSMYNRALGTYFNKVSAMLGSKRGEIATHTMSIRYPSSAKAVATLSNSLPANTVEIHRNMANILRIKNGDAVIAERFPCLGFMSVRVQRVKITDDPMCMYTIRVSKNSLVSQNLDFDGDVLFLASFHTKEAKCCLERELANPSQAYYGHIKALNERKGAPHVKEMKLQDFNIQAFPDLDIEEHARIMEKNTGIKAQTGPVIALTYNIMRIVENSTMDDDQKTKVAIEMFLERAAQSIFEQKHGGKSLYTTVTDGVCTADSGALVDAGFSRGITEKLCDLIKKKAGELGVFDLIKYHQRALEMGWSNIISKIVKAQNKIYYASRAVQDSAELLTFINNPAVDMPSRMFKRTMAGRGGEKITTPFEELLLEERLKHITIGEMREAAGSLVATVNTILAPKSEEDNVCDIRKILVRALNNRLN